MQMACLVPEHGFLLNACCTRYRPPYNLRGSFRLSRTKESRTGSCPYSCWLVNSALLFTQMPALTHSGRWPSQTCAPALQPTAVRSRNLVACTCSIVQDQCGVLLQRRQVLGAVLASSLALPASCSANSARGDAQVEIEVRIHTALLCAKTE